MAGPVPGAGDRGTPKGRSTPKHDHPLTDLLVYNLPVFRDDIDSLIRKIVNLVPENKVGDLFDWFSPPPLDEFKEQLEKKYSELFEEAKRNGWEIDGYVDPRALRAEEISQSIRSVLLRLWDSLRATGKPESSAKYDSYIPHLCQLLSKGQDAEKIVDYLRMTETDKMGIVPDRGKLAAVADELKRLNVRL